MNKAALAPETDPPAFTRLQLSPRTLAWANALCLAAILAVATVLRFYRLDGSSLWNDEGTTWALLARSYGAIAQAAAADIHPPGYYWLLKTWASVFGERAWALRSLSALAGTALVWVVYRIGRQVEPEARPFAATALLAALVAALNPFQVYYSQETRMYMLLALESAGLFWALLALARAEREGTRAWIAAAGYVLCGVTGLWTHYSFPVVLAATGLGYLWLWRSTPQPTRMRRLLRFVLLNVLIVAAFLPWLPTAVERILTWPKGGVHPGLWTSVQMTLATLIFGPLRDAPDLTWPWLLAAGVLPVLGIVALRRQPSAVPLALWLYAPPVLLFALGLFSPAFLKFLLAASPAWCLAVAAAPRLLRPAWPGQVVIALGAGLLAWMMLPGYYADPNARDNYAGIAAYAAALGDPATDLVILDAPGQQEVWRYYDPGLPVLALPEMRPPDRAQTEAALAAATAGKRQAFALLWATDEADPESIVERWLDGHAFKGLESWQGNVRFVVYSFTDGLACVPMQPAPTFGAQMALAELCQPRAPQAVAPGEAARVGLRWEPLAALTTAYKVSLQLLDARNHVIAQHDGEPAGGAQPTTGWQPGTLVADNHGLTIPPGTPPGTYRLILAVYDPATGARLPVGEADHVELGTVEVVRPAQPIPAEVVALAQRTDAALGPVTLAGYERYKTGMSYAPETPVQPGEPVHFTFLWQAPDPLPAGWPDDLTFTLQLGEQTLTAPLAGGGYPTGSWQPGELVRGEFDMVYDGGERRPVLTVGGESMRLAAVPE